VSGSKKNLKILDNSTKEFNKSNQSMQIITTKGNKKLHKGNLKEDFPLYPSSILLCILFHPPFLHPLFSPIPTLFFSMLPSSFL
jgi:hypothetical protein